MLKYLLLFAPFCLTAQDTTDTIFYATSNRALLYRNPDGRSRIRPLNIRETVKIISQESGWSKVATAKPDTGYVITENLSNLWIHVQKIENLFTLYRGSTPIYQFPADVGANAGAEKEQLGSREDPSTWRTPTGLFYVSDLIENSEYHRAFLINYPNKEAAERGLSAGIINRQVYNSIVLAEKNFKTPPQGTALGGKIEIHGQGTGGRYNWTRGCVALRNVHIDQIWNLISVGTPILIE